MEKVCVSFQVLALISFRFFSFNQPMIKKKTKVRNDLLPLDFIAGWVGIYMLSPRHYGTQSLYLVRITMKQRKKWDIQK